MQFTKPTVYTLYNQWNYFQRGCIDKWRSGDFSIQTWCIPLEVSLLKMCIYKSYLRWGFLKFIYIQTWEYGPPNGKTERGLY